MKKIVKRLVSLTCVAALAATCCVGASATSYSGRVGGFSWSASSTLINSHGFFSASTSGGWSSAYSSTIGVKANYSHATGPNQTDGWVYANSGKTSVTYDCVHYPTISNQTSEHEVAVNGDYKKISMSPSY